MHSDEDDKEQIINLLLDSGYFREVGALDFRLGFRDPEDYEANSPLSWAVEQEDVKYVKRFLSEGADPNYERASKSNLLKTVKLQ